MELSLLRENIAFRGVGAVTESGSSRFYGLIMSSRRKQFKLMVT